MKSIIIIKIVMLGLLMLLIAGLSSCDKLDKTTYKPINKQLEESKVTIYYRALNLQTNTIQLIHFEQPYGSQPVYKPLDTVYVTYEGAINNYSTKVMQHRILERR